MRILALMTEPYGGVGGIQQFGRDWLLAASGCVERMDVVSRKSAGNPALPENVQEHVPVGGKSGYFASALTRAWTGQYDLIYCAHLNLAPVAFAARQITHVPLWIQVYGVEAWHRPRNRATNQAVDTALLVTASSRDTRRRVMAWSRALPTSIRVLPPTFADCYSPGEPQRGFREELGLAGRKTLLSVGRLDSRERYKGHDRVIGCLPELLASFPGLQYLVVGDGDDRVRLEHIAREFGVSSSVRFLGRVNSRTLANLYRAVDLFVMPSTGEGFGIAFMEAMACGCPALGLGVAGARDALEGHALAHLTDEASLAKSILNILAESRSTRTIVEDMALSFGVFEQHVRSLLDFCTKRRGTAKP